MRYRENLDNVPRADWWNLEALVASPAAELRRGPRSGPSADSIGNAVAISRETPWRSPSSTRTSGNVALNGAGPRVRRAMRAVACRIRNNAPRRLPITAANRRLSTVQLLASQGAPATWCPFGPRYRGRYKQRDKSKSSRGSLIDILKEGSRRRVVVG